MLGWLCAAYQPHLQARVLPVTAQGGLLRFCLHPWVSVVKVQAWPVSMVLCMLCRADCSHLLAFVASKSPIVPDKRMVSATLRGSSADCLGLERERQGYFRRGAGVLPFTGSTLGLGEICGELFEHKVLFLRAQMLATIVVGNIYKDGFVLFTLHPVKACRSRHHFVPGLIATGDGDTPCSLVGALLSSPGFEGRASRSHFGAGSRQPALSCPCPSLGALVLNLSPSLPSLFGFYLPTNAADTYPITPSISRRGCPLLCARVPNMGQIGWYSDASTCFKPHLVVTQRGIFAGLA